MKCLEERRRMKKLRNALCERLCQETIFRLPFTETELHQLTSYGPIKPTGDMFSGESLLV